MLKGISPLISPELLKTLCEMGHGDEIILADAHFPGHSVHPKVIRADGLVVTQMLDAILPLMALDHAAPPVIMMAVQQGDTADPAVEPDFRKVIDKHAPGTPPIQRIDRFEFYERARQAFAVVMTTETRTYGNILLKKGVTPVNYAGGTGK